MVLEKIVRLIGKTDRCDCFKLGSRGAWKGWRGLWGGCVGVVGLWVHVCWEASMSVNRASHIL